jgi:hypothetical protein
MRFATAHGRTDLPDDSKWDGDNLVSPPGFALTSRIRKLLADIVEGADQPSISDNVGWQFPGNWMGTPYWFELLTGHDETFRLCVQVNFVLWTRRSREMPRLTTLCRIIDERLRADSHIQVLRWTLFEDRWWFMRPFDGLWDPRTAAAR